MGRIQVVAVSPKLSPVRPDLSCLSKLGLERPVM